MLGHDERRTLPYALTDRLDNQYGQTNAYVRNTYDAVQAWVALGGIGEVKGYLPFEGILSLRPTKDLQPYIPFQPDRHGNVLGLGGLDQIQQLFISLGGTSSELRNPQVADTVLRTYCETVVQRRFPLDGLRVSEEQIKQMKDSQTDLTLEFVRQFFDVFRVYRKFIDSIPGQQLAASTPKPAGGVQ